MKEEQVEAFRANGSYIGGICPISLLDNHEPSPKIETVNFSSQPDRYNKLKTQKRAMYGPEQLWSDPSRMLFLNPKFVKFQLSSEKILYDIAVQAYISIYPFGCATMTFWFDFSQYTLELDEIIELTAFVRGTNERINSLKKTEMELTWYKNSKIICYASELCSLFEDDFLTHTQISQGVGFIYPIIYIKELANCQNADSIIKNYSIEIAGLSDLWNEDYSYLKNKQTERIILNDIHPFNYGVTCVSTSATVELHPATIQLVAQAEKQSVDDHHLEELLYLLLLCEVPISQYFILRIFDKKLDKLIGEIPFRSYYFLIPFYPLLLMYQAIKLTKLIKNLNNSVNQFRHIYLTRKSYLREAIAIYRNVLDLQHLENNIDKKLSSIDNSLRTIYSMLTTIFTLVLSSAALLVAIIKVIHEFQK